MTYLLYDRLQFFFVGQIHHSQDQIKQIERAEENGDHEVGYIPYSQGLYDLELIRKKNSTQQFIIIKNLEPALKIFQRN